MSDGKELFSLCQNKCINDTIKEIKYIQYVEQSNKTFVQLH